MTERERFHACMQYRPVDRAPICDFGFWDETIPLWHEQGLPKEVNIGNATAYFGMDEYASWCWVRTGLCPGFEYKVLQDEGDFEVVRDYEGAIMRRKKFLGSIPMYLGHTLVDRESWRKEFKPKLDPDHPDRFPADWDAKLSEFKDPNRTLPLTFNGGSLYGWIRNWMGVEALSMVVYDEPAWFEEMVETIADLVYALLRKCLDAGVRFDNCGMWEDMCYSGGPLLSPEVYRRVCVPHYRRITDLLNRHGTEIVWVDCDGCVDQLVPCWLDAGINTLFPIEVGTWKSDPVAFRREYGRQLRLMGGFDKHILALTPTDIDAEIGRLTPLVEEGGFIPFCDHRVPPDVPLANYEHYLVRVRERWGKNLDLKPFRRLPVEEEGKGPVTLSEARSPGFEGNIPGFEGNTLDAVTLSEAKSPGFEANIPEAVTLSEAKSPGFEGNIPEAVTLSEAKSPGFEGNTPDAVTLSEAKSPGSATEEPRDPSQAQGGKEATA